MKRVFFLFSVLLFIIGSVLFLGAYFVFNSYSVSASTTVGFSQTSWQAPDNPLELSEGDKLTIKISINGIGRGDFYIKSAHGKWQIGNMVGTGNTTLYYYVQTNDLYYCSMENIAIGTGVLKVTLNIDVVTKPPNLLFLLIGVLVLFAGAVTIPVAFLSKSKK